MRNTILLFVLIAAALLAGCQGCTGCVPPVPDAGPDGGDPEPSPEPEDGGEPTLPDGGDFVCDENTPGFGDPCAAQTGDPLCGNQFCCTAENPLCADGQVFFCYDLGPNDCGSCGDLNTAAGLIGETCGEYECGNVECDADGGATICLGDHPRNLCGGCADLGGGIPLVPPGPADGGVDAGGVDGGIDAGPAGSIDAGPVDLGPSPGDICSVCETGELTCTRDLDALLCWGGRSPDNQCGGCDRCVLGHAFMDERLGGGYIRSGTTAIIEDIGDNTLQLVFDPLVEGPGANALPLAQVILNTAPNIDEGFPVPLTPEFAQSIINVGADPIRAFTIPVGINPTSYTWVVIYDAFLQQIVSAGEIVLGPIPDGDGGVVDVDGGTTQPAPDAGITDAGTFTPDAGSPSSDGG